MAGKRITTKYIVECMTNKDLKAAYNHTRQLRYMSRSCSPTTTIHFRKIEELEGLILSEMVKRKIH